MRRLLIIPAGLILLLAGTLYWSRGGVRTQADFTFMSGRGDIGTLDPNRMSWLQDIRIGYALWEGLYTLDPDTLDAIPGAAERVDVDKTKTVYTFHLRRDGKWTNGDLVT